MVNLIDVVISHSDGGDWRELGSRGGLRFEAAASAGQRLLGEGLLCSRHLGSSGQALESGAQAQPGH